MKRYYLDVITGNDFGVDYEVEADYYDSSTSGCYTFFIKEGENDIGFSIGAVVASYPISRTIIKRIEEI
jgi:hypothetical protein